MSSDYGPAIPLFDPRIGYGGWVPTNRHWIIVHGTAGDGTIETVQQTFISNAARGDPSSTHYAVGIDGRVGQYVPESAVAWGNGPITGPAGTAIAGTGNAHDRWWDTSAAYPGNANPPTFSIEHCKTTLDNSAALTSAQAAASFALISHLCQRWNIPRKVYGTVPPADATGGITGHFSMDPLNRSFCPGAYPWQALANYLEQPMSIILDHDAAGVLIGAHDSTNPAMKVGAGVAASIAQQGWLGATITVPETGLPEGVTISVIRGGAKAAFTYTPTVGVTTYGGDIAAACQDLYTLWQNASTPSDPLAQECKTTLETLKQTLGKLP